MCVRVCVYSKLGQDTLGQIVLPNSKQEERAVSLKMRSCMLPVVQELLFPSRGPVESSVARVSAISSVSILYQTL